MRANLSGRWDFAKSKEGQGLCPWTPLRAEPLEPATGL
jgi:hypothetical protein